MRCYWEQIGILGPIYSSLRQGLSNNEIARRLNLTEVSVESCVGWILHFLKLKNRRDLVLYASAVA
jgi:DNA-binding NarL/FixJ family response regulator